jgi:hypothetical protein
MEDGMTMFGVRGAVRVKSGVNVREKEQRIDLWQLRNLDGIDVIIVFYDFVLQQSLNIHLYHSYFSPYLVTKPPTSASLSPCTICSKPFALVSELSIPCSILCSLSLPKSVTTYPGQ